MKKHVGPAFVQLEIGKMSDSKDRLEGVVVIQVGPAKGHFCALEGSTIVPIDWDNPEHVKNRLSVWIDETTLSQTYEAMKGRRVKAKVEHNSGVDGTFGHYEAPRIEGEKLRADLTLWDKSPKRDFVTELFQTMPEEFGNSIDSEVRFELGEINGRKVAKLRLVKLKSVDIVDVPAATSALLSDPEPPQYMPLTAEEKTELVKELTGSVKTLLSEQLEPLKTRLVKLEEGEEKKEKEGEMEEDEEKDKEEAQMSAKEMAKVFAAESAKALATQLAALGLAKGGPHSPGAPKGGSEDEAERYIQAQMSLGTTREKAVWRLAKDLPGVYNKGVKEGRNFMVPLG